MDVSKMLEIHPAPRAVLDRLGTHRDRARFQVRTGGNAWQPVTWGQFATQIRGVARWLVEHELEAGERIAIYAPNSVAWAAAALGLPTRRDQERALHKLNQLESRLYDLEERLSPPGPPAPTNRRV